jgi:4-diphosphocytidyl-2-C-methyl-D-erythritol kinase
VNSALRLEAPAKINLSLRVVGRRDDGFHLLDSELVLLELADRLLLLPGCSGLRVEGAGADLPIDDQNLAWRGLRMALDGEPELSCLALEKRIPVAAGLGGGSSDAAAAWRLGRASRAAEARPSDADLVALSRVGADVPFFAAAVPAARVSGVGERVSPVEAGTHEVVLVHPPFGLSTAAVFAELRAAEWGTDENDLLAPARRLLPELDDVLGLVAGAGGRPQLTGSGPTVFTLDRDPERATAIAAALEDAGLRTTVTRTRGAAASIEPINEEE